MVRVAAAQKVGWSATASSVYSGSYPASNAIDSTESTIWQSTTTFPNWLRIDFGAPRTFNCVGIVPDSSGNNCPKDVEVWVSDDDVSYTKIFSGQNTNAPVSMYSSLPLSSTFTKRYLRLTINTLWTSTTTKIAELEAFVCSFGADASFVNVPAIQSNAASVASSASTQVVASVATAEIDPVFATRFVVPPPKVEMWQAIGGAFLSASVDEQQGSISGSERLGLMSSQPLGIISQPFVFDMVKPGGGLVPTTGQLFPTGNV